jgi:hypothetical protein
MAQIADRTETEVANRALSHIKKPRISSIDDDEGNTADTIRLHFASVRDSLLRSYPWNFAEDFASLPAVSGKTPGFGFQHFYELPEDCLWVREVENCGENDWKVSGRYIASDHDAPLKIRYTKRVVEVPFWDDLFRTAFAMHLAVALAPELATDENVAAQVAQKAADMLQQAYPADAAESQGDKIPDTDWVTGR